MKKAIGRIVIVGTMMAMSFYIGVGHVEKMEDRTEKIFEDIPDGYINAKSEEFLDNYVDMRQVVDFEISEDGLQLYYEDGSGYYLESKE